jgi:hypothetical protein
VALGSRAWATSDEKLIVVRLGRPDADATRKVGFSVAYSDAELLESARKWWISRPEEVVGAGHMIVSVATFAVALLHVTGVEDFSSVVTERGNTVKRIAYETTLLARVDDLVAGDVRRVAAVPAALEPLMAVLGQRVPSPPGAPLIAVRP